MSTDMETIKENNKLIAEFMGLETSDGCYFEHLTKEGKRELTHYILLEYHISWDWLIPVVKKIENLGYVFTIQGAKAEVGEMLSKPKCFISEDKLSSTYDAVIYIIKNNN